MFPEYADEYREMVQLCWAFAAAASHAEAKSAWLSLPKDGSVLPKRHRGLLSRVIF